MLRLLIADDEMIERQVLYKTLQKNLGDRCRIFQAANGREALKIYEEEKIQIAILDIEMPGINGIEAAQQIRQADKDCCIIFLTAFDEFSYAKKAITVRALDYLLKPYDEEELMLVVEEAMHIAGEHRQDEGDGDENENEIPAPPDTEEPEDGGHARLSKVTSLISQYIHENYMFDISMQDAARAMNYSEAYFCKLFKQCFDQNFTSYTVPDKGGQEDAKPANGQCEGDWKGSGLWGFQLLCKGVQAHNGTEPHRVQIVYFPEGIKIV